MTIEGLDALLVMIIGIVSIVLIAWAVFSLRFQFSSRQFVLFSVMCFVFGVFVESWVSGTREAVLSAVVLLGILALWIFVRVRGAFGRRRA